MCSSVTSSPNTKEMFAAALTKLSNAESKQGTGGGDVCLSVCLSVRLVYEYARADDPIEMCVPTQSFSA